MAASDQANGRQQLQDQGFGPEKHSVQFSRNVSRFTVQHGSSSVPWVPVVEAQRDLVDTTWMLHHQVEPSLKIKKNHTGSHHGINRKLQHLFVLLSFKVDRGSESARRKQSNVEYLTENYGNCDSSTKDF